MGDIINKNEKRVLRHARVRKTVVGSASRPRLVVFKSSKHLYAQVVDDSLNATITGASTLSPQLRQNASGKSSFILAEELGKLIAERCKEKAIKAVVFDRNGYKYHGVVKAIAEAVRSENLLA